MDGSPLLVETISVDEENKHRVPTNKPVSQARNSYVVLSRFSSMKVLQEDTGFDLSVNLEI